jgi:hypothetical protein
MTNLNLHLPLPPGAIDNSTASQMNIDNITVPANGSVEVVFDVVDQRRHTPWNRH